MSGENGTAVDQGGNKPNELIKAGEPYRWKPGQTGNALGRPKTRRITNRILRGLNKPEGDGKAIDAFVEEILRRARSGDFRYVKEIWDRLEGPLNSASVTNNYNGPSVVVVEGEAWKKRIALLSGSVVPQNGSLPARHRQP